MDLFDLPIEVLEMILDNLHVNDLLTCSMVCKRWRDGINQDFIWRQRCIENGYDPQLLENQKSHKFIEQCDMSDDEQGYNLSLLCSWRMMYNWYASLECEWLIGDYVDYKLSMTDSPVYCLDCDGDTLVTGHEDASVIVWSVTNIPHYKTKIQCLLDDYPALSIKTNSHSIIVLQKRLLQIYYQKHDNYLLIDAKSFEVGELNIDQIDRIHVLGDGYQKWYKECLRMNEVYCNQEILYNLYDNAIYVHCGNESNIVWSWTLGDHEKIAATYLIEEGGIRQMNSSNGVLYLTTGFDITHLLMLDAECNAFKNVITVPGIKHFTIEPNLILAVPSLGDTLLKKLFVWLKGDIKKKPKTRDLITGHHSVAVSHNKLIVYSENREIHVWDPEQDLLISSLSIGTTIGFIKYAFSTVILIFLNSAVYLWNWKTGWNLKTGLKLRCINNCLQWIGDLRQLVWISPSMLIIGAKKKQVEIISFL